MPSLHAKVKILLKLAKTPKKQNLNFSHSTLFHMKTKVSLKYFVNDCRPKDLFLQGLLLCQNIYDLFL